MNCKKCAYYELYKMITTSKGYGYTGDIPCRRCKWFNANDEFVPREHREFNSNLSASKGQDGNTWRLKG